jgi:hypothetical protein
MLASKKIDIAVLNEKNEVILIIEIKKEQMDKKGEDQLISYSQRLLDMYEDRFMIPCMLCTANKFEFFCNFRFKGRIASVSLGDVDSFSFGSNSLGLLNLLYVLQLPWPLYGLMLYRDSNNKFTVLKQKQRLGSGSSADVYEYGTNEYSFVFKFFESHLNLEFEKEVEIYDMLNKKNVSKEMLWSDKTRCLICMKSVREPISFSSITEDIIIKIYKFLSDFHEATNHIHRDIYHKNILISEDGNVFLNDFALAVPENGKHNKRGYVYFTSDNILMDENDKCSYQKCDDIYSLTLTLIFLLYEREFPELFNRNEGFFICNKRKQIMNRINKIEILSALKYAKAADYGNARDYIIKLLKNPSKSKN